MVGDLVDDQVEDIGAIVSPVSGFSAPDGQYFAQGEEEHMGRGQQFDVMHGIALSHTSLRRARCFELGQDKLDT